jgi:hypothetical protein
MRPLHNLLSTLSHSTMHGDTTSTRGFETYLGLEKVSAGNLWAIEDYSHVDPVNVYRDEREDVSAWGALVPLQLGYSHCCRFLHDLEE